VNAVSEAIAGWLEQKRRMDRAAAAVISMKECHPDLFAGMDEQAQALAERWTRALNAAYATLQKRL